MRPLSLEQQAEDGERQTAEEQQQKRDSRG